MTIDDLTIGQARELVKMFAVRQKVNGNRTHPAIGRYAVIRTDSAGVHVGIVHAVSGREVTLRESRRIWSWTGALSLSEISQKGITGGKVAVEVPEIYLTEAIEIIPTSIESEKCLREFR